MIFNIDPHIHLGGCISPLFVWEIVQKNGLKHLAESYEDVCLQMKFSDNEPRDFHRFLDKFRILDEIHWTEALIDSSIKSICEYLEFYDVHYAWMDFSINKYMSIGWHKYQAIKFIYDAFERHRPGGVGLILSIKYESARSSQKQYAKLIESSADYLLGIDLVGDEAYFDSDFYKPIFADWKNAGKITRAHVGESQTINNVFDSILNLGVTNIAHGIKIIDDPNLVKIAIENDISFDVSITSNYVTGVLTDMSLHPITAMLDSGLKLTLGSDDPIQCDTSLPNEFEVAKSLGVTEFQCDILRQNALENTLRALHAQNRDTKLFKMF